MTNTSQLLCMPYNMEISNMWSLGGKSHVIAPPNVLPILTIFKFQPCPLPLLWHLFQTLVDQMALKRKEGNLRLPFHLSWVGVLGVLNAASYRTPLWLLYDHGCPHKQFCTKLKHYCSIMETGRGHPQHIYKSLVITKVDLIFNGCWRQHRHLVTQVGCCEKVLNVQYPRSQFAQEKSIRRSFYT